MKVRHLGHSCVEIVGQHHIIIDPDFIVSPSEGVEYILVSHAHRDHIGRINEVHSGKVIASEDVCEIAFHLGVSKEKLIPVHAGDRIENIQILPGFSVVGGLSYKIFYYLYKHKLPDPGGTPLSFLIEDKVSVLHIGDAHEFKLNTTVDVLCVPWRKPPFRSKSYKDYIVATVNKISPKYVMPIHYDLPGTEADLNELIDLLDCHILLGGNWHTFS